MSEMRDRNFLEAVLEGAEAALDLATDNEAVKAVPVVGTAFKLLKGVDDLRDRALQAKLMKFLTEPALQTERARERMKAMAASTEEQQQVGEALFLTLERMTDLDKPSYLAKLFFSFLDDQIDAALLRRLAHAIDVAFIDDIRAIHADENGDVRDIAAHVLKPLMSSGLAEVLNITSRKATGGYEFVPEQITVSYLGRRFARCVWYADRAAAKP
jgi:hypothetical protein